VTAGRRPDPREKGAVFALGLLAAVAMPPLVRFAADAGPAGAVVVVYALVGALAAAALTAERTRPVGLGLLVGGLLAAASLLVET
jgi:hypothetical protein